MFCRNCGKELPDGTDFCTQCGQKLMPAETKNPTNFSPQAQSPLTSVQSVSKKLSGGKIAAIILGAVAVIACICITAAVIMHNQRQHQQELLDAQAKLTEAQQAVSQAQADAETALNEQEKAKADAEQAQKDAEKAKEEADKARLDAATQAAVIIAAITAAQDGDSITYDGYIYPSDRQYISEADMAFWDRDVALLARNEIYARHGYVFETEYIQNYFSSQSWYRPDSSYKGTGLSKVEQANVDTILSYEKKMGWQ